MNSSNSHSHLPEKNSITVNPFTQSPNISPTNIKGVTVQLEDKVEPFLLRNDSFGSNSGA